VENGIVGSSLPHGSMSIGDKKIKKMSYHAQPETSLACGIL
jgi:hypothetical protein